MKQINKPQGFTLVELLVVIVIIGILATGAISMFTGAQQKARDSVRLTDVQAVKLAIEQHYGDRAEYPEARLYTVAPNLNKGMEGLKNNGYIDKLPKDPKVLEASGDSVFVYLYGSSDDESTHVQGQEFELSTLFENAGNTANKSEKDTGNDDDRWETGVNIDKLNTKVTPTGSYTAGGNDHMADGSADDIFVIDCESLAAGLNTQVGNGVCS